MDENQWRETLNRQWFGDFSSLSNAEISSLIQNVFYQLFLIELDEIDIKYVANEDGTRVNFRLSGEAYRDPGNIKNYELE